MPVSNTCRFLLFVFSLSKFNLLFYSNNLIYLVIMHSYRHITRHSYRLLTWVPLLYLIWWRIRTHSPMRGHRECLSPQVRVYPVVEENVCGAFASLVAQTWTINLGGIHYSLRLSNYFNTMITRTAATNSFYLQSIPCLVVCICELTHECYHIVLPPSSYLEPFVSRCLWGALQIDNRPPTGQNETICPFTKTIFVF